ncbi:MAG: bile acid:sodium symporter family protein [Propylenella sp.]
MGIVTDVFLPLALAFIMFTLGLGLVTDDFLRVARQPKDFFVGALSQIVLLPAVAFLLASVWPISPELAVGLIIIAAAPGGATSNVITSFARGDVALSISLTAVTSLLCVLTIPAIVALAYAQFVGSDAAEVSVLGASLSVFLIITVPVLIGMAVRRFAEAFALRFEPNARRASVVLFVLVLIGAILQERENVVAYFAEAGLVTLVLNVVMMALAFTLATLFASGPRQRIAITVECGLQNGTLAIGVASLLFGGGAYVIPAATYSLIMFATALIFVALVRRTVTSAEARARV